MCLDRTIAALHVFIQRARTLSPMSHAYTILGIICAVLLFGLAACEREGPAERAGRDLDRAATDVRDAIKN